MEACGSAHHWTRQIIDEIGYGFFNATVTNADVSSSAVTA
jgi:hypothetical protein